MNTEINKSFQLEIYEISKKLDEIEIEIAMNQEALESIEMNIRFLKTELDFNFDNS
jgi:hypothetical protein